MFAGLSLAPAFELTEHALDRAEIEGPGLIGLTFGQIAQECMDAFEQCLGFPLGESLKFGRRSVVCYGREVPPESALIRPGCRGPSA